MVARHTELEERRRQRVASVDMVVQVANFSRSCGRRATDLPP